MMTRLPLLLTAAFLAGCSAVPPPANPPPGPCPLIGSSNWRGWVNAMPGPGARPTLIVTGSVTVPSGGWDFIWRDARVMESYPVQVALQLEPLAPQGPATQAVTTRDVRQEMAIDPPVGSVTVRCGETVLARISPVGTAH